MASTDPIRLLERVAANIGRAVPADLIAEVLAWVGDAAPAILAGEPVAEVLGLKVQPGARSLSRVYRKARRDAALTWLYSAATGSRLDRGEAVLGWIESYRSGDPTDDRLHEHLDAVLKSGLPAPTNGLSVARIAGTRAAAAPASPGADACGSIAPEERPIAAREKNGHDKIQRWRPHQ